MQERSIECNPQVPKDRYVSYLTGNKPSAEVELQRQVIATLVHHLGGHVQMDYDALLALDVSELQIQALEHHSQEDWRSKRMLKLWFRGAASGGLRSRLLAGLAPLYEQANEAADPGPVIDVLDAIDTLIRKELPA